MMATIAQQLVAEHDSYDALRATLNPKVGTVHPSLKSFMTVDGRKMWFMVDGSRIIVTGTHYSAD